ncbi:MAG: hypothetical protein IJK23_14540 [Clostridia bacterium]|nr:hypothetical protein [Clostridia bacterium]
MGTLHILMNTAAMLIVGYAVETRLCAVKPLICCHVSAFCSGLFMVFVFCC